MKTNAILTAIVTMSVIFTSCTKDDMLITPSSKVTTTTKAVSDFSKLEVSDAFTVYLTFSDTEEQVMVEANENLHQYIIVEEKNGKLSIRMKDRLNIMWRKVTLKVYITTSRVNEFQASGAANIHLQTALTDQYADIDLSGASTLTGTFFVNELNSRIIGASVLELDGSATYFDVDATGASEMDDFGFQVEDLNASLDGASKVSLTVSKNLDVKASGASTVYYKGDGVVVNQDLSGASRIVRLD